MDEQDNKFLKFISTCVDLVYQALETSRKQTCRWANQPEALSNAYVQ